MSDSVDTIITDAIRAARNSAIKACIELCEWTAEQGGCARCCVDVLTNYRAEANASDLVQDALEKARHG